MGSCPQSTKEGSSLTFPVRRQWLIDGTMSISVGRHSNHDLPGACTTGVLNIKDSGSPCDTEAAMKEWQLKGKDFFDDEHDPLITFHSTKDFTDWAPNT